MKDARRRLNEICLPRESLYSAERIVFLRFLQGWDDDMKNGPGVPLPKSGLPHRTLLPGLQFTLAGIIGKPAMFYEVPAVRFAFELLSYMYVEKRSTFFAPRPQ